MYMYQTYRHDEPAPTATLSESWVSYLLQLMMTSSGMILFFNMPCLGWSPRPRNKPGGSILKLPIFSLWPSIVQKPYSFWISSFFNFSAYKEEKFIKCWHVLQLLSSTVISGDHQHCFCSDSFKGVLWGARYFWSLANTKVYAFKLICNSKCHNNIRNCRKFQESKHRI